MIRRTSNRISVVVLATVSVLAALAAASCADSDVLIAREFAVEAGATNNSFELPPDAGEAAAVEPTLMCIGTECPAPFATCPPRQGGIQAPAPVYKCQNDLMTDNDNCGECGHACPSIPQLNVLSTCVGGKCVPLCWSKSVRDCNSIIEDGCEAHVGSDRNNCGQCGNKCADGEQCIDGNCGCPPGTIQCGSECVNPKSDDSNCGQCNNVCSPPDGATPPDNMQYACGDGQCGKLRCIQDNRVRWENCDGLLDNGCEIDLFTLDPNNCGACGVKCSPEETCRRFSDGHIACGCKSNETMCGAESNPTCVDIATNVEHCGACNHACPFALLLGKPHQFATCVDGLCGLICEPGWGDCNGNSADGCETNLMVHGGHCGGCGHSCDTAAGQPCINGACLMVGCNSVQN